MVNCSIDWAMLMPLHHGSLMIGFINHGIQFQILWVYKIHVLTYHRCEKLEVSMRQVHYPLMHSNSCFIQYSQVRHEVCIAALPSVNFAIKTQPSRSCPNLYLQLSTKLTVQIQLDKLPNNHPLPQCLREEGCKDYMGLKPFLGTQKS